MPLVGEEGNSDDVSKESLVQHTSSMVQLKAELARKQREAEELRAKRDENEEDRKARQVFVKKKKLKGESFKVKDDKKSEESDEELDAVASGAYREKLEAKAKLYETLSRDRSTIGDDLLAAASLVDFEKKNLEDMRTGRSIKHEEEKEEKYQEDEEDFYIDLTSSDHPGEGWVEYEDASGRKKYCLEADLPFMKAKAERRGESLYERVWENPREKEGSVHYQDVLQDEVREHGAGYFAFSTDEETRKKQQAQFEALRKQTKAARSKAEDAASQRKRALAERLKKVRQRKRLRAGLPLEPEEDEDDGDVKKQEEPEKKTEQSDDEEIGPMPATEPTAATTVAKPEKKPVRPWDLGKIGLNLGLDYTEKCWLREQRDERLSEFAPPSLYKKDSKQKSIESPAEVESRWNRLRKPNQASAEAIAAQVKREVVIGEDEEEGTDKRKPTGPHPFKNKRPRPTPYSSVAPPSSYYEGQSTSSFNQEEVDEDVKEDEELRKRPKNPDFAPPATLDYYGPSGAKSKVKPLFKAKPQDVEAALAFARKKWEDEHGNS